MQNSSRSIGEPAPMGPVLCVKGAAKRFRFVALLFLAAVFGSPAVAEDTCTSCHEQGAKLSKSAHASLSCDSCHVKHKQSPHPPKVPKPVCTDCHTQQGADYESSIHGQTAKKGGAAPDCSLCHGG